jgi:hypothetical protein
MAINMLQTVETYQMNTIAWLLNQYAGMDLANKKFIDFENKTSNLGDKISFEVGSQTVSQNSLVITTTPAILEKAELIAANAISTSNDFNEKEFTYQAKDYMNIFGYQRAAELGSVIERSNFEHITGTARYKDDQNPLNGQLIDPSSGPYRFFGNGVNQIDSFTTLSQIISNFKDYGSSDVNLCGIIPITKKDIIIGNGLDQFALNRNNSIAESWDLGTVSGCRWTSSNLLPVHMAGTIGDAQITLTLVSTNDPSGNNITQLTFSSSLGNDINAIKAGDPIEFIDVSGQPRLRYRQWFGHGVSNQPVQVRATGDAESIGGQITVNIYPPLQSTPGPKQNLSTSLQAGMQATIPASHIAGVVWSGNPFYVALPKLSDQRPYDTSIVTDPGSGISLRSYWGALPGLNKRIYATDSIYGAYLLARNALRVNFPLN